MPGVGARPPSAWPGPRLPDVPTATPSKRSRGAVVGVIVLAAVIGAGLFLAGYAIADRADPGTRLPRIRGKGLDVGAILARVQPSVVSIQAGEASSLYGGSGSGVIVESDGLILTNNHVIEGSSELRVQLNDGTTEVAQLVGASPDDDIAVIRIHRSGLTAATLGSSDELRVGDDVLAIGNALNLGGTPSVTRGIVSAVGRRIDTGTEQLDHLIQTDAAINPGNSGGPLVNARGEVVGLNTAIIRDAQNIGFAIAIDPIRSLIRDLEKGKAPISGDQAFLGVGTVDVGSSQLSDAVRQQYGVTVDKGAFVQEVDPDRAAGKAGMKVGDVIVAVDGTPIASSDDLGAVIRRQQPGDAVAVIVERKGARRRLTVALGRRGG